jgi:hypothetical protein
MNLLRYCKFNFFRQRSKLDDNFCTRKNKRIFISLSRKNCCEILFNDDAINDPHLRVIQLGLKNLSRRDFNST